MNNKKEIEFEFGVICGVNILSRWVNGEIDDYKEATDIATQELIEAGYGYGLLDQAFDIAIASDGDDDKIAEGLRNMLSDWENPL